jgi:hypothetical protein
MNTAPPAPLAAPAEAHPPRHSQGDYQWYDKNPILNPEDRTSDPNRQPVELPMLDENGPIPEPQRPDMRTTIPDFDKRGKTDI